MSSKELLVSIVRYVKSRYEVDIRNPDKALIIKKAEYLAKARRDKRLSNYLIRYSVMSGATAVPVLRKAVKLSVSV